MDRLASALLNPRRIALIGGSSDPKRLTARAQVYLRKHGFTGDLFPINPSAETILGERAYPRLADVPGDIDLAYLLLGTQHVEGQIAAVAEKRIPVAAILADGFAEAGDEGRALQERLLATAKAAGVRLLGPNSMGLVNLNARTACSVNAALEAESLPAGRIALVSQSGSMRGAIMARGVHGQNIYIDPQAEMVIARYASHPVAANIANDPHTLPAYHALALALLG